jgi:hypothetical protein
MISARSLFRPKSTPASFEPPATARSEETRYFMGVDLGQANDPTAIAVIRPVRYLLWTGVELPKSNQAWPEERPSVFQCGYLERVPLGVTYPAVVNHVASLLMRPIWNGKIDLIVDATGVGAPVVDLFKAAGITHSAVTITGGNSESRDGHRFSVPKMTLISQLQALLHEGRLQIQKELPDAAELVRELQDFRVNYTETGRMTFGAREGRHDDMVLALAMAVWRATKNIQRTRWTHVEMSPGYLSSIDR